MVEAFKAKNKINGMYEIFENVYVFQFARDFMGRFVYSFSESGEVIKKSDDEKLESMRSLLGGKGFHLAKMSSMGLSVPCGFTITTEACKNYYENNKVLCPKIITEIYESVKKLEVSSNKSFFHLDQYSANKFPLLVSVRSGARSSMPGMMDTILNIGMNRIVAERLLSHIKDEVFVLDVYIRFLQMFSEIVGEVSKSELDFYNGRASEDKVRIFKKLYERNTKKTFPEEPKEQLIEAVKAVFRSWENPRAKFYRKMHGISESEGTAVNVQMMVFGNLGKNSGTGVAFSRSPITGEKGIFGEFLEKAQGEDVVAGLRTPLPLSELKNKMPEIYSEFSMISEYLENEYRDMQDIEFTVERGKLYLLQTRTAKRSAEAALKVSVDFVREGKTTKQEAVLRLDPGQIERSMYPCFDYHALKSAKLIASGLAASPGVAVGRTVFCAKIAKDLVNTGEKVILVRRETSPEDIEGMQAAEGILTACGGITSHAAVVARGMGRCCVVGCEKIKVGETSFTVDELTVNEGDFISIDGSSGKVYLGEVQAVGAKFSPDFEVVMSWADELRRLGVYANADSAADVRHALKLGAQGVGLCRTEHMFFKEERIKAIREMILSKTDLERQSALKCLLPFQKSDFKEIFSVLESKPITIRLLDLPLHEFLPESDESLEPIAHDLGVSKSQLLEAVNLLREFNPMMGHRGCRLFVSYPEIAKMQTQAIIGAAVEVFFEFGYKVEPEIMIPLVGDVEEVRFIKKIITETAENLILESHCESFVKYKVGTMIEVPRAAVLADKIASEVQFFSFGTNDLTQMTFGFSRDDASKFLNNYYEKNIYKFDPFKHIDCEGVGALIKSAVRMGRSINSRLKIGVCGEHGGDPESIKFFNELKVDYVSCSPYRVPVARLAAAQAELARNYNVF